jgi:hypothetical protein
VYLHHLFRWRSGARMEIVHILCDEQKVARLLR